MAATPKRLGIFVTYDSEGIVDDYIPYLLEDMCQNLTHLVIVCNGFVNEEGIEKLRRFTDDIFVRENKGYDAGAIKDVLYNLYGWEKIYGFDELVLFNDSFFGPLYPFKAVFDEMDKHNLDFWGLIEQGEFSFDENRRVPTHFQSYFTVIKSGLLKTSDYKDFWDTMPPINTFYDAVFYFEYRMKSYFLERGYAGKAYIDFNSIKAKSPDDAVFAYEMPFESVVKCKSPIIKRKAFTTENSAILKSSNAEGQAGLMEYISKNTDYDVNLIWDNILRVCDAFELRYAMHLDKVLPSRAVNPKLSAINKKTAIVIKAENPFFIDEIKKYAKNLQHDIAVFFYICDTVEKGDIFDNFEYICYIGDLIFDSSLSPTVMLSAIHSVLENMIKSPEYIENIINEFELNPRLGMLTSPHPLHSMYFSKYGGEWGEDFDEAQGIAERLKVRGGLSQLRRPFMSESAFWCRTKTLSRLPGHDILKGLNIAEIKILPYAIQKAGFYNAVVMSDSYAALQNTNCEYMLAKMIRLAHMETEETNFDSFISSYIYRQMLEFCKQHETIYIYGAGDFAGRCANNLFKHGTDFAGFVVADGRHKQDMLLGRKVYYLAEIERPSNNVGIVLGMEKGNAAQVFPALRQKGYKNLFVVS